MSCYNAYIKQNCLDNGLVSHQKMRKVIINTKTEYSLFGGVMVCACHWTQGSRVQTRPM
jgi:hypothetical protein